MVLRLRRTPQDLKRRTQRQAPRVHQPVGKRRKPRSPERQRRTGMPSTLGSGWPDEAAWSQSFEWPAMKPSSRPSTEKVAPDGAAGGRTATSWRRSRLSWRQARNPGGIDGSGNDGSVREPSPLSENSRRSRDGRRGETRRGQPRRRGDAAADRSRRSRSRRCAKKASTSSCRVRPVEEDDAARQRATGLTKIMRAEVRRAVEATREELSGAATASQHFDLLARIAAGLVACAGGTLRPACGRDEGR